MRMAAAMNPRAARGVKPQRAGSVVAARGVSVTAVEYVVLFASALGAGAVNSVAGGGSLLTFPALLAVGVSPLSANATSTVALVPGSAGAFWGYRELLKGDRATVVAMAAPSLVGGVLGALLVLRTGDKTFGAMVPWLVLGATLLFAAQGPIGRAVKRLKGPTTQPRSPIPLALFQLVVAVYGGFFGAGIGILMLAALALRGEEDIHKANGLKNLAAVCINGVATVTFVASGRVSWTPALVMATGAVLGGWGGAGVARKLGQTTVRRIVLAVGFGLAALMFWRQFR